MEFLPPFDCPLRKETIEIMNFDDEKSTFESSVRNHHFNHALDVCLPDLTTFPVDLKDIFEDSNSEYYIVHDVTIDKLLDFDFIGAFVKKGKISVLSDGTRIDVDNSVCVYHPGMLVVSLTKDDYEELGLQGKPSSFGRRKKKPAKYVVTIDLTGDSFFPGKKSYDRALKLFQERKDLKFDLIFSWVPHDYSISCRSLYLYLLTWGHDVDICVPQYTFNFIAKCCTLKISSHNWTDEDDDGIHEFMEFIGSLISDIKQMKFKIMAKKTLPVLVSSWTGFLSSEHIYTFIQRLKNFVVDQFLPWAAVVIHGFDDAPISWNNEEHGYATNGDNLCTIVVFPDSYYWMCKGLGANDFLPNCKPCKRLKKPVKMDE